MTDADEPADRPAAWPFLAALAIIVIVVIGIWLLDVFSGDDLTDEQQIARAASGQNDALQREDFADFRAFSCAGLPGSESEVLSAHRDSVAKRGDRYVDRVAGVAIEGQQASADVTYYFDNDPDVKETVEMTFAREDGSWKVCSTGPS